MSAVITGLLALLEQLAGLTSEASVIANIVSTLEQLVPVLIQEYQAVLPAVKNIIAALSANPASTTDQLNTLKQLDAQVDASFEAAAVPQPGDPDYVVPSA